MGRINLLSGFLVRDIPKVARDYLYKLFYPIVRRRNLFVIEYPSLFNECRVFSYCFYTGNERSMDKKQNRRDSLQEQA